MSTTRCMDTGNLLATSTSHVNTFNRAYKAHLADMCGAVICLLSAASHVHRSLMRDIVAADDVFVAIPSSVACWEK